MAFSCVPSVLAGRCGRRHFPYCMLGGTGYNRFRQFTMHWLPNYGPTYYAAFVHDPEGNNIEAMLA